MNLLTKEQQELCENAKICYIYGENLKTNYLKNKNIVKLEIIVIIQGNIQVLHIAYVIRNTVCLKKIPIVFHNESNYNYHFIIKELAEEFKNQFTFLGENTEKYITFRVPIEKEVTRIDKNGEEITKYISYILQIIDSARFMADSLSNLLNNLSEGIHRIKCKFWTR